MAGLIGKSAPTFSATAVQREEFQTITLNDFNGKFLVLFFYPMDFTRVCASEMVALAEHLGEFKKRDCEVLAVSCDNPFSHLAWIKKLKAEEGLDDISISLLSDKSTKIAREYGVYCEDQGISSRAFFLIDKQQVIRYMSINDRPVARKLDEILHLLNVLQTDNEKYETSVPPRRGLKRTLSEHDLSNASVKSSKISDDSAPLIQ